MRVPLVNCLPEKFEGLGYVVIVKPWATRIGLIERASLFTEPGEIAAEQAQMKKLKAVLSATPGDG